MDEAHMTSESVNQYTLAQEAQQSFDLGDYAQARALLAQIPERSGKQRLILGRTLLKLGDILTAVAELEEAARQMPESWEVAYYLGCAYGHSGEPGKAEQLLSKALALHPPSYETVYFQRGHARLKLGQLDLANRDYATAERLGLKEGAAIAYECLGLLYAREERYEDAYRILKRAFHFGRESDALLRELGRSSWELGKLAECVQYWCRLQAQHPEEEGLRKWLAEAHFRRAAEVLGENRKDRDAEVRRHLESAQALRPEDPRPVYYLALLTARGNGAEAALLMLQDADCSPAARHARALLLNQTGNTKAARAHWMEAVQDATEPVWILRAQLALAIQDAFEGNIEEAVIALREIPDPDSLAKSVRRVLVRLLCQTAVEDVRQRRWRDAAGRLREIFSLEQERRQQLEQKPAMALAAATVFLLAEERSEAVQICEKTQQATPNTSLAHFLLICSYWEALHQAEPGGVEPSKDTWERAIANAAFLLQDSSFWDLWCKQREKQYQCGIDKAARGDLRIQLEEEFLRRLPVTTTEGIEFRMEMAGARALEEAGGLQLKDHRILACGPLMLRKFRFEKPLARLSRERFERGQQDQARRLRLYFSSLGEAQSFLDHDRPGDAILSLGNARCERCASQQEPSTVEERTPRLCREDCEQFDRRNPAYAELPQKGSTLQRDALTVAVEANLTRVNLEMGAAAITPERVKRYWQETLRLADLTGSREEMQQTLVDHLLGRVDALAEESRLDDAVRLLDEAHRDFPDPWGSQIGGRLAEVLNYRAVKSAEASQPNWKLVVADCVRALNLNPHLPHISINLVIALCRRASEFFETDKREMVNTYKNAQREFQEALTKFPDREEFAQQQLILDEEVKSCARRLNADGVTKRGSGQFEESLKSLWFAHELDPDSPALDKNIIETTDNCVRTLKHVGRQWLERALKEYPDDETLLEAADLMQYEKR